MTATATAATVTAAAPLAEACGFIAEMVKIRANERPHHRAVVQDGEVIDYAAFDRAIDRVAAALQRDGATERGAIAICAGTSINYVIVFLGALRAGIAVAPLAPSLTATNLADMIADSDATHMFLDAAAATNLGSLRGSLSARCIALDGSNAGEPLAQWLQAAPETPSSVTIDPDWPFNIIYSSGTTGTPKGIVQPHRMRWAHIQRGPMYGYGPEAISLISTPLYSNTTLVAVLPVLALGGTLVLMAKFDAAGYLALAQREHVTHTMLVPVQYQRIMALADFDRYDLSSFRVKFSTSAPFSASLKAEILRRWPGGLIEFYGMTEGGGTCILVGHERPDKLHSVGLPVQGHDIRIIDEDGLELPRGAVGEIVGRSPAMMTGYHKRDEMTARAEWFDAKGNRFIRTGDIGRFDEDGFLVILDRKKDMIISGGFNVYPSDIEAVLRSHDDVVEVAVVGVPSTQWGETPVAFAVLKAGSRGDGDALRDWVNARVAKTQRLASVQIVDALPRSAIGKILKRELRDIYAAATLHARTDHGDQSDGSRAEAD